MSFLCVNCYVFLINITVAIASVLMPRCCNHYERRQIMIEL